MRYKENKHNTSIGIFLQTLNMTKKKNIYLCFSQVSRCIIFIYFMGIPFQSASGMIENTGDSVICNKGTEQTPVIYINTNIENGSPFNWEIGDDGTVNIMQVYDYQRGDLNRTFVHLHFLLEAKAGSDIPIIIHNFKAKYKGREVCGVPDRCVVSLNGKTWKHIPVEKLEGPRMKLNIHMETDSLYIASVEPYRYSDYNKFLSKISKNKHIHIETIGQTVEGRYLHIIRIGKKHAPHNVFIRARAHPWEPGGNWVVEGLTSKLLDGSPESKVYLENYALYILPMTNIDGVLKGADRYNMNGMDLNRDLDKPANPVLSPENAAMETWLERMIRQGLKPDLAIDFHNDSGGSVILASASKDREEYFKHMDKFKELLWGLTWHKREFVKHDTPGTAFNEGLLLRYGIDAMVFELNATKINTLEKKPLSGDWKLLGSQLCEVFYEYFRQVDQDQL